MNISRDLDPLPVQRTQISFKGKRKHTAYVNIPNLDYKYQNIILKNCAIAIVPDNVQITFNLDTESTNKTRSIITNVSRALVKKNMLTFESKKIKYH